MTNSSAVNWLVSNATERSDGTKFFTGKTIPDKMYTDIRAHVESLDTDKKAIEPRYLNWVEDGLWFELRPQHASRTSRARYENGRVQVHFECGEFVD